MNAADADPANVRLRRGIGAAAVLLLAAVVVLLQLHTGRERAYDALDGAFDHLAKAALSDPAHAAPHLDAAETAFARGTGTLVLEPQAVLGLGLLEGMRTHLHAPSPPAPEPAGLDEKRAVEHVRALLVRGRPAEALDWLHGEKAARAHALPLAPLRTFAERWRTAIAARIDAGRRR